MTTPREAEIKNAMTCLHAHADDCECRAILAAEVRSLQAELEQAREQLGRAKDALRLSLGFVGVIGHGDSYSARVKIEAVIDSLTAPAVKPSSEEK